MSPNSLIDNTDNNDNNNKKKKNAKGKVVWTCDKHQDSNRYHTIESIHCHHLVSTQTDFTLDPEDSLCLSRNRCTFNTQWKEFRVVSPITMLSIFILFYPNGKHWD